MTLPIALLAFLLITIAGPTVRRGINAVLDWCLYVLGGER